MKIVRYIRICTFLVLLFCLFVCGYILYISSSDSWDQSRLQKSIASYKPQNKAQVSVDSDYENLITNQNIIELQRKYPDVQGWLTLDNTVIDYPFVQSLDNEDYLRADLDGNYSMAGTVFADCRCDISSSFATILYGHNMENGTMFADIGKYEDADFWAENTSGMLFLPHKTYRMEIFAFLVVNSAEPEIYTPENKTESDIADFLSYLSTNARQYRDAELTVDDKVLVLSTCNYEFTGARSVLIVKLVDENQTDERNEDSHLHEELLVYPNS